MAYAPRTQKRTRTQIEADRLDLALFRLRDRLEEFATLVNSPGLFMDAMHIGRARQLVQKHMHPTDRKEIKR